ncbi:MAG: hypothetical protein PUF72_00005, partial [Clostridiales bacterium]|nr:hypothetical protein [Clostridiales bacterium]
MGVSTFINDVVENMGFLEDEAANILLGDESSFEEHDIEAIKNATEHSITRFRDEIKRVFAHCEEALEIDPISKVVEINNPLPRFLSEGLYSDLAYVVTERLKINHKEPILGGNIVIESEVADNVGNDPEYNMAIGYAIEPMLHKRKRPNLLLNEHKDKIVGKYINRAVGTIVGGIAAVCLVAGMVSVGQNLYIKFLTSTQDKQSELKNDISKLQSDIQDTQELIANYKQRLFDCNDFVECVLGLKPANVTILSVDSADVIEYTAGLQKQEEDATKKKKSDDTDKNENSEENTEEKQIFSVSKPGYKDDIVNKRIILRGYSQDQTAISEYVYNMSRLNSVKSVEIAGVEEKMMLNVGKQCVFEMFMDIQNAD